MTYFLFRARLLGAHMHIGVWAGTEQAAHQESRAKVGDLTMTADEWSDLSYQLRRFAGHGPCIFDIETVAGQDQEPVPPTPAEDKIHDLMAALETSVNEARAARDAKLAADTEATQ